MTPEQLQLLTLAGTFLGGAVTMFGGPPAARAGLKWYAGYKERRAKAREALELKRLDADSGTIAGLFARMTALDARLVVLEGENAKLRDEIAQLRDENATLRRRLERYEARSTTPPGGQVYGLRSRRDDMEPKE